MAISPINVSRISNGLRTDLVLDSLRRTQLDLFLEQSRIAAGRQFLTPGENPAAATRALDLTQALARQEQFTKNLQHADQTLAAADSALVDVNSLLIEASTLTSQNVSNLTSASERAAVAELVAGIRQQLQAVGNKQFNGRYIFAGRATTKPPFVDALGGIAYLGDTEELMTAANEELTVPLSVTGDSLFGALSSRIESNVDLTPSLTPETRLEDLNGANGRGIRLGTLIFHQVDGAGVFTVDLAEADTIGDIVTRINNAAAQAGADVTASLSAQAVEIQSGPAPVSIQDTSTGVIAADLGLLTDEAASGTIVGANLQPRLTRTTPVSALAGGAGLDLASGMIVMNGGRTTAIDVSQAETVQDILNEINNADLYLRAKINDAGTGIDVFNQVSGTSLRIGENGGTTAKNLGIRTFTEATPLHRLNYGQGVAIDQTAADLRITAMNGATVEVDLNDANTVGDVLERINAAAEEAGVRLNASLATVGNGIRLVDETGGAGTISVRSLNLSAAAENLGLQSLEPGDADNVMVGEDMNPVRTDGVLAALVELETALRGDDTSAISLVGERLAELTNEVTRIHGIVGARAQSARGKMDQMEQAASATHLLLSEVRDLDYAEAVTRMQSAVTQLQGNLQTSAVLLNVSLLDYLS